MSIHSQLLATISFSQTNEPSQPPSLAKNHLQYLKQLHLHNNQQNPQQQATIQQTITNTNNKLPLNLFMSPTQYHKMLITKGKSRKNNHSQIINGELLTLQYHNDPIFLKQSIKKKYTPKHTNKPQLNQSHHHKMQNLQNMKVHNRRNSLSQTKKLKYSNLSNSNTKKPQSTIECDQLLASKKRSFSATQKPQRQNSTTIKNSRKTQNSFNKSQKKKSILHDDQNAFYIPKRSRSQKNTDISHLIIKSLIDFNQTKKAQKLTQANNKKTKQQKQEYLKQLNQQIRIYNLHQARMSRSKSRQKSFTKQDLALDYWDHIKDKVLSSLKNDNYSQPLKQQLRNYHFNVYEHKEIPKRKPQLSRDQMKYLAQIHEEQAKSLLKYQQQQKRQVSQKIKKNLKILQKQRRKRIQQALKKPFNPTAEMIRSAFQNIVEPNNSRVQQHSRNKKAASLFRNQKLKMKNISNLPRN